MVLRPTESILDQIFKDKAEALTQQKRVLPLQELQARVQEMEVDHRDFRAALEKSRFNGDVSVVAEVKKASPSAGVIAEMTNHELIEQAALYNDGGADAISVLTEEKYFQGDLHLLAQIREVTEVPLLRKDFIFDPYQLFESVYAGADAVLLIVASLDPGLLEYLLDQAYSLNLDVLLETHTPQDIETVLKMDECKIIGINARDLQTFEQDLQTVVDLASLIPQNRLLVAESAIKNRSDVLMVRNAGASSILVGTSLMKEAHPDRYIQELKGIVENGA